MPDRSRRLSMHRLRQRWIALALTALAFAASAQTQAPTHAGARLTRLAEDFIAHLEPLHPGFAGMAGDMGF